MNSISLIVPLAADKPEYADTLPYVFGLDEDGVIVCVKSIMGLNPEEFSHIYFSILRKHDDKYFIADSLRLQFKRLGLSNAEVVILDEPTRDQAETIYMTIAGKGINGPVFIKDGDCFFKAEIPSGNAIATYPIEELEILDPRDKSYVAVDDMNYITNIIEKRVVGHFISAGGYFFSDAGDFCRYYDRLRSYGRLYLSHIVYSMLLDKINFRPVMVENYKDWGNGGLYRLNR